MEVVATVETTRWTGFGKPAILIGVRVGLCSQIPNPSIRINDTSGCDTNSRIDVYTAIQISSQEGYVHVSGRHDIAGLCVDFVKIVLCGRDVDVLYAVTQGIDERLREDLLRADALEVAW